VIVKEGSRQKVKSSKWASRQQVTPSKGSFVKRGSRARRGFVVVRQSRPGRKIVGCRRKPSQKEAVQRGSRPERKPSKEEAIQRGSRPQRKPSTKEAVQRGSRQKGKSSSRVEVVVKGSCRVGIVGGSRHKVIVAKTGGHQNGEKSSRKKGRRGKGECLQVSSAVS
jgi:hypothetical protein